MEDSISSYSDALIKMIMDLKEVSYYEISTYFKKHKIYPNAKELKDFNLNNELDKLERMGIIRIEEGMIIFQEI
ncbi:DEAD/DEAH box helicase [uncultured Clostridium sp.]|uniref:DEAD/DEAH box helicase n=1 Tax=uncultured Clostridium sp. TaxID=59620 RepID=UPI0025E34C43|nr:DEAD/DEAH box helicase [uncultured Clostridium sp.]